MNTASLAIHADIRTLVPHGGNMCLMERIVRADEREIECATATHRSAENPLRHEHQLAALHLAEYGAQTMAVHGGLLARAQGNEARARGGMLVAIRELNLAVARLDDIAAELRITATRLMANADGQIYAFTARAGEQVLGTGRVSVMFGGGA
jgi:predicted hotdog family 3-hydroxylacyl-ACP dehydratase